MIFGKNLEIPVIVCMQISKYLRNFHFSKLTQIAKFDFQKLLFKSATSVLVLTTVNKNLTSRSTVCNKFWKAFRKTVLTFFEDQWLRLSKGICWNGILIKLYNILQIISHTYLTEVFLKLVQCQPRLNREIPSFVVEGVRFTKT